MARPFFSIITCVYNSGGFLDRNIASVSSQSFKGYEHVIVYSPSKDKSKNIIRKYMKVDSKAILANVAPSGISAAFNAGILKSRGEYLMFLNSDDYFYDGMVLSDAHKFLKSRKELDWIYGVINVVEENGKNIGMYPKLGLLKKRLPWLLKLLNYIPHQSVFIKREVVDKFGLFDEGLESQMDYEYWLRIASKTRWKFMERVISNYTIRRGAKSSSKRNDRENRRIMRSVQKRYTNKVELFLAGLVESFVHFYNRTTR